MNVNYDDERFTQVEQDKQNELNKYNQTYDSLIAERENLTQQQQDYVDNWKTTQEQIANDNLNHQLELYNQQKEKAEQEYQKEAKASYIDYQKEVDKYGVSRENAASNGLSNSGYAESSKVDMYNTYQNRVATARESLNNIKLEFDNAIKEAQLSNNATLAELALQQMQQKLEIALEGFNYKDTQTQNKLNWEYNINNTYYDRYKDVENQINYENEQAEAIRQFNEQMEYKKQQDEIARQQWEKEYELQQQQLAAQNAYYASLEDDSNNIILDGNSSNDSPKVDLSGYSTNVVSLLNNLGLSTAGDLDYYIDKDYIDVIEVDGKTYYKKGSADSTKDPLNKNYKGNSSKTSTSSSTTTSSKGVGRNRLYNY